MDQNEADAKVDINHAGSDFSPEDDMELYDQALSSSSPALFDQI